MSNDPNKKCNECDERFYNLVDLLAKMRHAQKDYFRTRAIPSLRVAQRYEKEVDAALIVIDGVRRGTGQKNLFNE